MKPFKFYFTAFTMLFLLSAAKADDPKIRVTSTMKFSISAFIAADTRGICDGLTDVIDDNAKFNMMRGDKMLCFNKKQVLNNMEILRGIRQNCTTNYTVVEAYGSYALFKVEMKYPTFSRINYITMNQGGDGWKISNVTSVFSK